jgi:pimeloyl-ACP methyl ester carboxylesterase
MANFVLIHGAWGGGWVWRRVVPLLRRAGHEVFAPSLTGLGDRAHLSSPQINLETHIRDTLGVLESEELTEVILVGHSYGGMVITGAADRAASRLARLVYLDAFLPENGKASTDYLAPERSRHLHEEGRASGMVSMLPIPVLGLKDPADIAWAERRSVKQSYLTFTQPVILNNPSATAPLPKTFIQCTSPATGTFDQFVARIGNAPGWNLFEVKTGHMVMMTEPARLAEILLSQV